MRNSYETEIHSKIIGSRRIILSSAITGRYALTNATNFGLPKFETHPMPGIEAVIFVRMTNVRKETTWVYCT